MRSVLWLPLRGLLLIGLMLYYCWRVLLWVLSLFVSFRFWLLILLVFFGLLIAYHVQADRLTPMATDAYLQAYVVQVAPQVEGRVVRVCVHESEMVAAGDLLFELDARPFEHKSRIAEARATLIRQEVRGLQADLAAAEAEQERNEAEAKLTATIFDQERRMFTSQSTTERRFKEAELKNQAAQAAVRASQAKVRHAREILDARLDEKDARNVEAAAGAAEARLNLEYTRIVAPCAGRITDLQLREGAFVRVGQPALTLIDTAQWQIVANIRENSLAGLQVNQKALVSLRGLPGQLLPARVVSVGWGVGQGQGVPSGMLPDVKRNTSWIPPSQRFQVRLVLEDTDTVKLRLGMTGVVSIYTDQAQGSTIADITQAWHQVLSWLDHL